MKSTDSGFKRVVNAAQYSLQGLRATFKHEMAFRQELAVVAILIPVTFFLDVTINEQLALIVSLLLVLLVELLNSAVEAAVDRISEEPHELAGRAKDMSSAAVMVSLIIAVVIWGGVILF
ncbi:diacylglycerol kinase [Vibrio sp. qd031]|uniref:diacylglycerol kinase n=1 Tax=Vibrio sp. qd031 TaxID=1603038 RepID=UPI000A10B5AF|nr:diacylglycerol kinase [Vibrio sp. qd031]ORT51333.1 diacylglycerol kinase [Vibrio sp. qd031]